MTLSEHVFELKGIYQLTARLVILTLKPTNCKEMNFDFERLI